MPLSRSALAACLDWDSSPSKVTPKNPGVLRNCRKKYRKSWPNVESILHPEGPRGPTQIHVNGTSSDRAWERRPNPDVAGYTINMQSPYE